jgi:hypothetical protein
MSATLTDKTTEDCWWMNDEDEMNARQPTTQPAAAAAAVGHLLGSSID